MNAMITVFYDWSRVVAGYFTWAGPLAVRIVVGWVFLWSGWTKLHALPRMIENFREWGIPAPEFFTPLASGIECVGGILLLIGLLTRFAAVPMMIVMGRLGQVGRRRFAGHLPRLRRGRLFRHVRLARHRRPGTGIGRSFHPEGRPSRSAAVRLRGLVPPQPRGGRSTLVPGSTQPTGSWNLGRIA